MKKKTTYYKNIFENLSNFCSNKKKFQLKKIETQVPDKFNGKLFRDKLQIHFFSKNLLEIIKISHLTKNLKYLPINFSFELLIPIFNEKYFSDGFFVTLCFHLLLFPFLLDKDCIKKFQKMFLDLLNVYKKLLKKNFFSFKEKFLIQKKQHQIKYLKLLLLQKVKWFIDKKVYAYRNKFSRMSKSDFKLKTKIIFDISEYPILNSTRTLKKIQLMNAL